MRAGSDVPFRGVAAFATDGTKHQQAVPAAICRGSKSPKWNTIAGTTGLLLSHQGHANHFVAETAGVAEVNSGRISVPIHRDIMQHAQEWQDGSEMAERWTLPFRELPGPGRGSRRSLKSSERNRE